MALVERVVFGIVSKPIYISIFKIFLLGNVEHLVAVVLGEKLALLIEQLESVPVAWVVTGSDDDASSSSTPSHGKLGGRCSGQPDVNHIVAHTHEGAAHHVLHHLAGDARITSDNNLVAVRLAATADEGGVS